MPVHTKKPISDETTSDYLREHPGSRRAFIAMHLGIDRHNVDPALDRLLQKMRKAGKLRTNSGGYWWLTVADSAAPPPAAALA